MKSIIIILVLFAALLTAASLIVTEKRHEFCEFCLELGGCDAKDLEVCKVFEKNASEKNASSEVRTYNPFGYVLQIAIDVISDAISGSTTS